MQDGLTIAGALKSGFSGLGVLVFQWVPSFMLALSTAGNSTLASPALNPISTAVSVPQVQDYLQSVSAPSAYTSFINAWGLFAAISIFISLILLWLLVFCVMRLLQVRRFEHARFAAASASVAAHDVPRTQLRWERITSEISSDNEQSWRLAILEADIMLNELLDSLGYRGETMADKMRGIERGDFNTIDLAWEAHRARNRIAHESSETPLNPRDARQVIDLYTKVFREFRIVS
jgi:hypothetical protein